MAGYDQPQAPLDEWARCLYEKHGLGDAPTMAMIEPIARSLLSEPTTMIEGGELVLGRHINAQESDVRDVFSLTTVEERFGMLLLLQGGERFQAGQL